MQFFFLFLLLEKNEKLHLHLVMLYEFKEGVGVGRATKDFKTFVWIILLLLEQLKSGFVDFEMLISI